MALSWIPLALVAGFLQILRNAAQRGLSDQAGPWGATLVRFLYGLPFAALFLVLVAWLAPPSHFAIKPAFWIAAPIGATAQVCATAALIQAMRASSFGLGSTFQHMSLPLAALVGVLFLGDHLGPWGWLGILVATGGLILASWPRQGLAGGLSGFKAGLYGLASGACFAVSANCYRLCGLAIDPSAPLFSATFTLVCVQGLQSAVLGGILLVVDRPALQALAAEGRASWSAGLAGAAASACWFAALTLAPAALVRALNALVEAPTATLLGWIRFKETIDLRRGLGSALIVVGVIATVLSQLTRS
ncbi:DMT family transporter [Candidatus Phycosocius bacilliformis]|nr:DMT family transporter [Candidatus Phycosocius bacilliformis]